MNVKYEEMHPDVFARGGGCALSPLRALSPLAIVIFLESRHLGSWLHELRQALYCFLEQWEKPIINSENPLEAISVPPGFSISSLEVWGGIV